MKGFDMSEVKEKKPKNRPEAIVTPYELADPVIGEDGKPVVKKNKSGEYIVRQRFDSSGPKNWKWTARQLHTKGDESKGIKEETFTDDDLLACGTAFPKPSAFADYGAYAQWVLDVVLPGATSRAQAVVDEWNALSPAERAAKARKAPSGGRPKVDAKQVARDAQLATFRMMCSLTGTFKEDAYNSLVAAHDAREAAIGSGDPAAISAALAALQAALQGAMSA